MLYQDKICLIKTNTLDGLIQKIIYMKAQPELFKGNKGEWSVKFQLLENSVFIETFNQSTMTHYESSMTEEKIAQDKNFGFLFATVPELFKFLQTSFDEMNVRAGEISIQMQVPLGKMTRKLDLKIPTVKKQIDISNIRDNKIKKIQKEMIQLRKQNSEINEKLKNSTEEIEKMKTILLNFQKILQQKDEVINSIFFQLKEIRMWKEQKQNHEQTKLKKLFIADSMNPHNKKFLQIGNRYKKTMGGSWDLLICQNEIPQNDFIRYTIRQIRAGPGGSFMYGIGTAGIHGVVRAQDSKQFIGYYQNTGNIYDRGESKKGGPRIKDGDIINVQIDTKNWTITWIIQGVKQAEITINGDLKIKPIYLAFIVYNEDAEIQFI